MVHKRYWIISGVSESGRGTPNPHAAINPNYNNSEKNDYTARPPTFIGDSTEFEWWKNKMYTHIMDRDNELWDILEDGIDILVLINLPLRLFSNRRLALLAQI